MLFSNVQSIRAIFNAQRLCKAKNSVFLIIRALSTTLFNL